MAVKVDPAALETRVDRLVAAQAARTPDAVAVESAEDRLTFAQLERRASVIAERLRSAGVCRESLVGLYLERSTDMVASMLGIWKAGGAYVPLDPDFPADRIAYMVEDAAMPVVVTQASLRDTLPPTTAHVITLDEWGPSDYAGEGGDSRESLGHGDCAYVIYTSGSTGRPKGVVLEHRGVVNFLLSMQQEPGLEPSDVLVAVTTLSFDISGLELLLPLIVGARVIIASRVVATDGEALRVLLESSGATIMQATPSLWRLLIEAGWQGGPHFKVLCGGEALPSDLSKELLGRCGALWNLYGPTETTIWSTCYRVPSAQSPVLIGRPIANTPVYVLGRTLQPVPTGVPGEIFIGGVGVARGYLRREELTAERFVADPFRAGERMYRTGDVGRYLSDGNLEFRNRVDHQVKLRGFRIELGEIEAALASHAMVKQAVARIWQASPSDARLVAYVITEGDREPAPAELRDHLRRSLPQYMIPQHFVSLDRFPLTPNGKVDRAQLLPPSDAGTMQETYVAPRTETEKTVAAAWKDALGVERVGVEANFFDLGGHSVLAVRVVARLRKELGFPLGLRALLLAANLESFAQEIDGLRGQAATGQDEAAVQQEEIVF